MQRTTDFYKAMDIATDNGLKGKYFIKYAQKDGKVFEAKLDGIESSDDNPYGEGSIVVSFPQDGNLHLITPRNFAWAEFEN